MSARKKGNCRLKRTTALADVEAAAKATDPYHRWTFRALAESTGFASTRWRLVKAKNIRRRTSCVKPMLTDKHKTKRKGFFATQVNRRHYLWHGEKLRTTL
ncbi:hypothetical protein H310_15071 [Aphanomyces invadans]|uniref:Uncharacterized protein n=1 Tax=Aphanomyces invadans TaxID=157072 RepID=A0A024T816_9STRA|nr:hypothetical protein H310_15071 [Aphanomyces invadans]ETV90098.1 hypothetical protein H310_15071 [Aphanomyces invadans]|eukprot:XP_008881271.1 hypothetical protein H310_15071 [Aphanomyces invadans]